MSVDFVDCFRDAVRVRREAIGDDKLEHEAALELVGDLREFLKHPHLVRTLGLGQFWMVFPEDFHKEVGRAGQQLFVKRAIWVDPLNGVDPDASMGMPAVVPSATASAAELSA